MDRENVAMYDGEQRLNAWSALRAREFNSFLAGCLLPCHDYRLFLSTAMKAVDSLNNACGGEMLVIALGNG